MDKPTLHPTHFDEQTQTALIEAIERLTSTFWGPTSESCRQMKEGTFWASFEALAPYLECDPPDAMAQLKKICAAIKTNAEWAEKLEEAYVAAFINRRGGIRASLYASSYFGDDTSLMDEPVRLMEKRFASKGLQMAAERNEPADHLAIQLEFCFFLITQKNRAVAMQEAAQFVNEGLLTWVPQFYAQLRTEDSSDFYCLAAGLLMGVLNLISALG